MQFPAKWCFSQKTRSLLWLLVLASLASYVTTATVQRLSRNCLNATFEFSCDEEGGGASTTAEWYFNGTNLHRCLTNATKDQKRLITKVSSDCEGFLQCALDLQSGSLSEPIPVYTYPQQVLIPFSQSTVIQKILGTSVTIQCDIIPSALSNFNIMWYHNNTEIPDVNEYVLRLDNLSISDNGNYSCSAKANFNNYLPFIANCDLVHGSMMQLNVIESLQLAQELEFIRNSDGTYNFTVLATGANVTYRWSVNDVPVNTSTMPLLRQDFEPGSLSQVTVEISDGLSPFISQTVCVYTPALLGASTAVVFIGTTIGLSILVGVLGFFLILCFTIIIVHHRNPSKKSDSKQQANVNKREQQVGCVDQSKPQQPLQSQSQKFQSTDDEPAEFYKNTAKSFYENSQAIKPILFVRFLEEILLDASSRQTIQQSDEEFEAYSEFIQDMLEKSKSLVVLYNRGILSKQRISSSGRVQTDDGDDGDLFKKQIEKLRLAVENKELIKFRSAL